MLKIYWKNFWNLRKTIKIIKKKFQNRLLFGSNFKEWSQSVESALHLYHIYFPA